MVNKTPNTRLTEASEALAEVDELADGLVGVVIGALRRSSLTKHVGQESGVAGFLVSHELDVGAVLCGESGIEEVLRAEDGKAVVEKIQLNPFLVNVSDLMVKKGISFPFQRKLLLSFLDSREGGSLPGTDQEPNMHVS